MLNKETMNFGQCSAREKEIVEKVLAGLPNKTIGEQLFISENTVKFHCKNIYKKLNVTNRTSLFSLSLQ